MEAILIDTHNISFYGELTVMKAQKKSQYSILCSRYIMQTCPCNVDPLTSHFYIVKLGFTGVLNISYFCSSKT